MANNEKKPGPGLKLSITILGIGLAMLSVGSWRALTPMLDALFVQSFETPGNQSRELGPGEYDVYGQIAQVNVFDLDSFVVSDRPNFDVDQIRVTDTATGNELPVVRTVSSFELGRSTTTYVIVGSFEVTEKSTFNVEITSEEESQAVVGRSGIDAARKSILWFVISGIGLFLFFGGLAMLILGSVRRGRASRAAAPLPAPQYSSPQSPLAPGAVPPPPGQVREPGPTPQPGTAPAAPTPPPAAPFSPTKADNQTPWD